MVGSPVRYHQQDEDDQDRGRRPRVVGKQDGIQTHGILGGEGHRKGSRHESQPRISGRQEVVGEPGGEGAGQDQVEGMNEPEARQGGRQEESARQVEQQGWAVLVGNP